MGKIEVAKEKISLLYEKGAIHILAGNFINRFINLFGTICLVRLLSKEEYGLLTYAENIYSFVYLLVGMGLNNSVIRYVLLENHIEDKKMVFDYVVKKGSIYNLIVVAIGIAVNILYPHPSGFLEARNLIFVLLLIMPLSYLIEISLSNERAFFSNKMYAKISITTGACIILAKMIGALVDNSTGVVIAFLIIELLLAICCIRYETSKYYRIKTDRKISKELKQKINVYGIQYMFTNGLWAVFLLMDIFLLATVSGDKTLVAEYKVAYTLPACLSILSGAIGIFVAPYFIKNESNINWVQKNYKICFAVTFGVVFLTALFIACFSKYIIILLYGKKYLKITTLMNLLLIASVINAGIRFTTANILAAMGQVKYNMCVSAISILLQITINYFMIPKYGAIGVAITSIAIYSFMGITLFIVFNRKYNVLSISRKQD